MGISLHLAMTSAEISASAVLPEKLAYMACHFSPYGTGLSNLPQSLPPDSMLILNDRMPICSHDPKLIAYQLSEAQEVLQFSRLLLDFQRPDNPETHSLCKLLTQELPCPVGVSDLYAKDLDCPVFLSACPPYLSLREHWTAWNGREIWLEAALHTAQITVTESGSTISSPFVREHLELPHFDESLLCHYRIDLLADRAQFTLVRTRDDLSALLLQAESLGVKQAVGLWQELHT